MNETFLYRWTRAGVFKFSWNAFETFENLILPPTLQDRLKKRFQFFSSSQAQSHAEHLLWRYGMLFVGPPGSGKTAASHAMAQALGWDHFTLPGQEIFDSHLLEKAFSEAIVKPNRVILFDHLELILQGMEPHLFCSLFDEILQRQDGILWIATSRYPENLPKTQLHRPGRFDEMVRFELPTPDLFKQLLTRLVNGAVDWDPPTLEDFIEKTEGLSFAHLEEMRRVILKYKIEKESSPSLTDCLRLYLEDQLIARDRWGRFLSDRTEDLQRRLQHIDARMLMSALDMTDIFKKLIEKVLSDSQEDLTNSPDV